MAVVIFLFIIQFTALFEVYMWIQLYRVCLRYNSTRTVSFTGNGLLPVKKKTIFVRNKHNFKTCTHYTIRSFLENGCWKESKYCQLTGLDLRIHVKVWWLLKAWNTMQNWKSIRCSHLYFKYISEQPSYLKKGSLLYNISCR